MDSEARIVREGIVGMIGATTVAAWFLVFDAIQRAPLRTPAVLWSGLVRGSTAGPHEATVAGMRTSAGGVKRSGRGGLQCLRCTGGSDPPVAAS